jgi:hypothetical protein
MRFAEGGGARDPVGRPDPVQCRRESPCTVRAPHGTHDGRSARHHRSPRPLRCHYHDMTQARSNRRPIPFQPIRRDDMSCAYRSHHYRSSVTARPASVFWNHAHHPPPLCPLVVHPGRKVVTETSTSTDNASIPVRLIQYLWSQWQMSPSERDAIAAAVGALMQSPRWHWDVTVLPRPLPTRSPASIRVRAR